MIKVDNSARKRFFCTKKHERDKEFKELKNNILNCVEQKNYKELNEYKENKYSLEFSVFYFHKKIKEKLSEIENTTIKNKLLSLDWYRVLCGDILEIREIIKENKGILSKQNLVGFSQYQDVFTKLYEVNLSSTSSKFKKPFFELFDSLDVCPYCNRNFINPICKESSLGGDNKNQFPDIEHFFPKSIYPFLSLSISNILPSCAFCNKIKSDVDTYNENCLSPYEIEDNEFEFDFTLISERVKEVKLVSKSSCRNSEILHIEDLYNDVHSEFINEIFDDILKHPKVYRNSLTKEFKLTENDYKKTFRNYYEEKDLNKQPLSKMTKDLYFHIKNHTNDD